MPFAKLLHLPVLVFLLLAGPVFAQNSVPEHRYLYTRDTDFYGADLTNLFDTTEQACARACAVQQSCVAFTFNTRSNACFPKSAITDRQPYQGALSARKIPTDPRVLALGAARLQDLGFLTENDLKGAHGLVNANTRKYAFDIETSDALIAALQRSEETGNTANSLGWAAQAVAFTDRGDLWVRYAYLSLRLAKQEKNRRNKRLYYRDAIQGAVNGYLRAESPAVQVDALDIMAQGLEDTRRGRSMIPALRLAMALSPREDIAAALEQAIGKYGFRVVRTKVDNNAAAPRICAEFSEKLLQAGMDYEPFVRVEGRGLVVQAEADQLCLDGVEHGQRYDVTLRQGLPAASGEALHKDVRVRLYVRDRAPLVRFPGRAYVLPRSADAGLPIESVNVDQVELKLRRVSDRNLVRVIRESYFGRPLSAYEDSYFAKNIAEEIWTGQGDVQNELNVDMTTRLPLGAALADQAPGVYALSASVKGQDPYEQPAATQWFVLSDMGLSTWSGVDGMQVNLRRFTDASAMPGAKVTLISQANAVLGEVVTDADGFAAFPAGLTRGTGAAAPALIMAEDGTTDVAFLPLTDPAFDLSDRGVEGHPPAPPIDTFVTTDRGAYRVGETIYATVLTRDDQARALSGLPVTAILSRPDGVEYSRHLSSTPKAGGHVFALPLGGTVPRGAWRLDIKSDVDGPALASQTVLVEDFLPERIDFEMSLPDAPLRISQSPPLSVNVNYLFGAPGADLSVNGFVRLRPARALDGWKGYKFGRYDSPFRSQTKSFNAVTTDAQGNATVAVQFPKLAEDPGVPLEAQFIVSASEASGRPVERRLVKPLTPDAPMIGIKPLFDDVLGEGAEAVFEVVAVGPDSQPVAMPVRWSLNKVETRYQWYQLNGNWEWEPTTRRIRVANGEAMLGATPTGITAPTSWGSYEFVVERADGAYTVASVDFSAGWYGGDSATDTPDRLQMSLDAETYDVGDTAQLRVVADGEGVALVSVLSNRVVSRQVVAVSAGENLIPMPVTSDWGSGAYVTASVLRGMDEATAQNPSRSLGLAHASVRPGDRKLEVSFDVADVVDGQAGTLRASVQVAGVKPGETAFVTLAAVDVGVLNLTGFEAPDVADHYFGQRRLGVEMRDIYGRLIDGMNGAMGVVRSGGDAGSVMQVQSPPPTEELMSFFTGPITVGADGRAEVEIIKPAFNGTVKLMAVAWSDSSVGSASQDVIARDPVVVSASLPRFMATGDQSRLLLELVHAEGPSGEMALQLFADAGVAIENAPTTVALADQGTVRLNIPLRARELGDHMITVVLRTPEGKELRKSLLVPVRDNDPEVSITRQFALGAGESFTFDSNVFAGFRTGTARATLTAGPLARFDVPGLLRQLDRYPYGCTEQLTSGAMPLLYLSAMAETSGLGSPPEIDAKITKGIERILTRQASNGGFGMWRASSGEFWLDAYVTDFLSRARAKGHAVPEVAFTLAMDNLRNRINFAPDFDNGGEAIAYAMLVLAREGAANMGDLRYYADTKSEAFATPLAAAQLAAALASYGDQIRADKMFRRAGVMLLRDRNARGWRSDFGTDLRDRAAVLRLSAEAGSQVIEPTALMSRVTGNTKRLSTQEAAQIVMAAHALTKPTAVQSLRVDGQAAAGPVVKRLSDRAPGRSVIENVSSSPMDVTMTSYGIPEVAPPEGGYGYNLTRSYYTMEGTPVQDSFASGDRMVVVLTVSPFEKVGARLILNDPLPAGFEIDNPNLIFSGQIGGLEWLKTANAQNAEFRSDRFIAAVDHRDEKPFRVAYVVRAVMPGTYHHPAATVEDMYRAEYRANTATGQVTVTP